MAEYGVARHQNFCSGANYPRHRIDCHAAIDFDPYVSEMDRIIDAWLPLTFAANSLNRSMGQPDLYPFVVPPPVLRRT